MITIAFFYAVTATWICNYSDGFNRNFKLTTGSSTCTFGSNPVTYLTSNLMLNSINTEKIALGESIFATSGRTSSSRGTTIPEEDVNFCLREADTALSATSRSKVLNEVTNNVLKALIIGYEPIVNEINKMFGTYLDSLLNAECVFDEGEVVEQICPEDSVELCKTKLKETDKDDLCTRDLLIAKIYIDRLKALLTTGSINDGILGGIYDRGYKRLLTILKDCGCTFEPNSRPKPIDQDICLSLLDKSMSVTKKIPSKTKILNSLSNSVYRAVLYGRRFEKNILVTDIETLIPKFAAAHTDNNVKSQEILYLKTLVVLLKEGFSAAVNTGQVNITDDRISYIGLNSGPENGYLNNISSIDEIMSERLFDVYQNAFQRIVECCFTEMGKKTGNSIPENNEILLNIANWEKNLRVEVTEGLWKRNPQELVGTWSLSDVMGDGTLTKFTLEESKKFLNSQTKVEVPVELTRDGRVILQLVDFEGGSWTFTPGPAHLDTCEFVLRSRLDSSVELKYVGFIDRGQRIESRFSNLPIRMTGRVISIERGVLRGSNRFIMLLPRTKSKSKPTGGGKARTS